MYIKRVRERMRQRDLYSTLSLSYICCKMSLSIERSRITIPGVGEEWLIYQFEFYDVNVTRTKG